MDSCIVIFFTLLSIISIFLVYDFPVRPTTISNIVIMDNKYVLENDIMYFYKFKILYQNNKSQLIKSLGNKVMDNDIQYRLSDCLYILSEHIIDFLKMNCKIKEEKNIFDYEWKYLKRLCIKTSQRSELGKLIPKNISKTQFMESLKVIASLDDLMYYVFDIIFDTLKFRTIFNTSIFDFTLMQLTYKYNYFKEIFETDGNIKLGHSKDLLKIYLMFNLFQIQNTFLKIDSNCPDGVNSLILLNFNVVEIFCYIFYDFLSKRKDFNFIDLEIAFYKLFKIDDINKQVLQNIIFKNKRILCIKTKISGEPSDLIIRISTGNYTKDLAKIIDEFIKDNHIKIIDLYNLMVDFIKTIYENDSKNPIDCDIKTSIKKRLKLLRKNNQSNKIFIHPKNCQKNEEFEKQEENNKAKEVLVVSRESQLSKQENKFSKESSQYIDAIDKQSQTSIQESQKSNESHQNIDVIDEQPNTSIHDCKINKITYQNIDTKQSKQPNPKRKKYKGPRKNLVFVDKQSKPSIQESKSNKVSDQKVILNTKKSQPSIEESKRNKKSDEEFDGVDDEESAIQKINNNKISDEELQWLEKIKQNDNKNYELCYDMLFRKRFKVHKIIRILEFNAFNDEITEDQYTKNHTKCTVNENNDNLLYTIYE